MNDNPREAEVVVPLEAALKEWYEAREAWLNREEMELDARYERAKDALSAAYRARAKADLPAPSATCECGHDEDSHLEGQEADLDGRPVGKPYTYCHWCVNEDRADRWHDFKPAPAASQSVEEAREALLAVVYRSHGIYEGYTDSEFVAALAAFERAVTEASQNRVEESR